MFKLEKIRAVARTKTTLGSHSLIYTSKALCPHKKTFVYVDFNLKETDKIWTNQSIKKSKIHGTQYQGNRCTRFLLFLISRCKAVSSTGERLLRFLWSKENETELSLKEWVLVGVLGGLDVDNLTSVKQTSYSHRLKSWPPGWNKVTY